MFQRICAGVFLLVSQLSFSQYTDIINSNRPGISETAYAVGEDVIQFENGMAFDNLKNSNSDLKNNAFENQLTVRYGKLKESLEFIANIDFRSQALTAPGIDSTATGLRRVSIGGKYNFFTPNLGYEKEVFLSNEDVFHHPNSNRPWHPNSRKKKIYTGLAKHSWKARNRFNMERLKPTLAGLFKLNIPVGAEKVSGAEGFTMTAGVLAHNQLTGNWTVINNVIVDNILAANNRMSILYVMSHTYSLERNISVFGDLIYENVDSNNFFKFGTGAAYLFSKDLQFDASYRISLAKDIMGHNFMIGASYRIDNHKDKWIERQVKEEEKKANEQDENGRLLQDNDNPEEQPIIDNTTGGSRENLYEGVQQEKTEREKTPEEKEEEALQKLLNGF